MKKIVALLLSLAMILSLTACGNTSDSTSEGSGTTLTAVAKEDLKIGFVHLSDASDMGYTYNHDLGTWKMVEALGLDESQIINKYNVGESSECATALRELAEEGCQIIFATSFGFEDYVLEVAAEYPNVQFCHATGYQAADFGLDNVHNYFGLIYQARYLAGIIAGLQTETNLIGYVASMPYAEVISGFDAFYLGALSVNPDVEMVVMYTNTWNDPTKEEQVAQALIAQGCDVISQHCDSTAAATAAEKAGIYHIGYNSNMIEAAPNASLTSVVWDWSIYLTYAVECVMNGESIVTDWSKGLLEGVCDITELNEAIVVEGAAEAVEAARELILSGEWDVFTGPLMDVDGNIVVAEGETFIEPFSAPSFAYILQGITVIE